MPCDAEEENFIECIFLFRRVFVQCIVFVEQHLKPIEGSRYVFGRFGGHGFLYAVYKF